MTTAAAWQRTIDRLDPAAFGAACADEVMGTADQVLGEAGDDATYELHHDDLQVLLGMAALAGFRRLVNAASLEAMTGDAEEDAPEFHALETTIESIGIAAGLMDAGHADRARTLLGEVLSSWQAARGD